MNSVLLAMSGVEVWTRGPPEDPSSLICSMVLHFHLLTTQTQASSVQLKNSFSSIIIYSSAYLSFGFAITLIDVNTSTVDTKIHRQHSENVSFASQGLTVLIFLMPQRRGCCIL